MRLLDALGTVFVPPLCLACGRLCGGEASLCEACARRLAEARSLRGAGPPGVDAAWSSAPHEGVARALVVALKFRRLLPVAELMADRARPFPVARLRPGGGDRRRPRGALGRRHADELPAPHRRRSPGWQATRGSARQAAPNRGPGAGSAQRAARR